MYIFYKPGEWRKPSLLCTSARMLLLFAEVCQGGGIILLSDTLSSLANFLLDSYKELQTSHSQTTKSVKRKHTTMSILLLLTAYIIKMVLNKFSMIKGQQKRKH